MEIRTLRYFLMVAKEQNMTRAAELLHITQPTLSRQLMALEEELGITLFLRGKRKVTLTDAGFILKRRAEEIVHLSELAKKEVDVKEREVYGQIAIGCGITEAMQTMGKLIAEFKQLYPRVSFHVRNGNGDFIAENIDHGLLDVGFVLDPADLKKYDFIGLKEKERWGLVMRTDDVLAKQQYITMNDLKNIPLIGSPRENIQNYFEHWFGKKRNDIHIVSTSDLSSSGAVMVKNKIGKAIMIEGALADMDKTVFCFRPFQPEIFSYSYIIWKKYQSQNIALAKFLSFLKEKTESHEDID